jgi:hypothetical protein
MLLNLGIRNNRLLQPTLSDQYKTGPGDPIFTSKDRRKRNGNSTKSSINAANKSKALFNISEKLSLGVSIVSANLNYLYVVFVGLAPFPSSPFPG